MSVFFMNLVSPYFPRFGGEILLSSLLKEAVPIVVNSPDFISGKSRPSEIKICPLAIPQTDFKCIHQPKGVHAFNVLVRRERDILPSLLPPPQRRQPAFSYGTFSRSLHCPSDRVKSLLARSMPFDALRRIAGSIRSSKTMQAVSRKRHAG